MNQKRYSPINGEVFHIHTYRCKHAGTEKDEEYVEKAVQLGAKRIVFTDHVPFPGNPFGNRMDYEQIPEYLSSIGRLKEIHADKIELLCGFEAEYLPSYKEYYKDLADMTGVDILIIGQHFYENSDGSYSFSNDDKSIEYVGLCDAMIQGIETGLFSVVAHPDRAFRRRKTFENNEIAASRTLIKSAFENGIYLEKNYSSTKRKRQYWEEFWNLIPDSQLVLQGIDAHSVKEIEEWWIETTEKQVR